jgi:hypothetical protein
MNRQRAWLWLAVSAPLLSALISACSDAGVTSPRVARQSVQSVEAQRLPSVEAQRVSIFDGVYTNQETKEGGYVHNDRAIVSGTSVWGVHTFSNGVQAGIWIWTGTISVDRFDPTRGTITGKGIRTDKCCGSIKFDLTSGSILVNADGTAALFYTAHDPRFGDFGSAAYRPRRDIDNRPD